MANFGPIGVQSTDATGSVVELRTDVNRGLDTNWNKTCWIKLKLGGSGAKYQYILRPIEPGQAAPTAPTGGIIFTAGGSNRSSQINSGEEVTIGIPVQFGYDDAGNRAPPVNLATHLGLWCITAGTDAVLTIVGG